MQRLDLLAITAVLIAITASPYLNGRPTYISPDNGGLLLPPGFQALVVADNVGEARQLAVRENGDIYAALMNPIDLGYIVAMRDVDGDGVMDIVKYFGEIDSQCKSLLIYKNYLYVGSRTQIVRFPLADNQLLPTAPYEVVVSGFPKPHAHASKNFTFDDSGNLYVEAGSNSNSGQIKDRTTGSLGISPYTDLDRYAGVWVFDAETLNQTQQSDGDHFATGIRNDVAFQWDPVKRELYGVQNGRDNLHQNWGELYNERESAELPAEEFQLIKRNSNFGWPYAYYDQERKSRIIGPEYGGDKIKRPPKGKYHDPILAFPGHQAPIGLQFYNATQFPEKYRGGAFISFHGGWNRAPLPQKGFNIVFVPFDGKLPKGEYEVFADGFKGAEVIMNNDDATYRPTGLALGPDGSLYVSEDQVGRIWKIMYTAGKGVPILSKPIMETKKLSVVKEKSATPALPFDPKGRKLYEQYCMACHQSNGTGVRNMQPSLVDSERLSGVDDEYIVRLVLQGSAWVSPQRFTNVMPGFSSLSNDEIASILDYVEASFGKTTHSISSAEVEAIRRKLNQ